KLVGGKSGRELAGLRPTAELDWPNGNEGWCSPLANRTKEESSSAGTARQPASSSAICLDGRRSPDSIFSMVGREQPTHSASRSCVRSTPLRRCLSHCPNDSPSSIQTSLEGSQVMEGQPPAVSYGSWYGPL